MKARGRKKIGSGGGGGGVGEKVWDRLVRKKIGL